MRFHAMPLQFNSALFSAIPWRFDASQFFAFVSQRPAPLCLYRATHRRSPLCHYIATPHRACPRLATATRFLSMRFRCLAALFRALTMPIRSAPCLYDAPQFVSLLCLAFALLNQSARGISTPCHYVLFPCCAMPIHLGAKPHISIPSLFLSVLYNSVALLCTAKPCPALPLLF